MISERRFASSFDGFWSELLPLLTPTFVHMVGEAYKESLTDAFGSPLKPVEHRADTDRSVIAEFAFYLAKNAIEKGITIRAAYDDPTVRSQAETTAGAVVRLYEGAVQYPSSELSDEDLLEGLSIAENYQPFLQEMLALGSPVFNPIIAGAGFLQTCQADIAIGRGLFEVKTVARNIAGKDIRQLIVYLALQAATSEPRWTVGGFFNPRKAEYHRFEVDELIAKISGGRSASEIYHTLIDFACSWDVQIDTAF